ncbi:MAG: hypothetical protein RIS55_45, partial [Actinomycetota bacterium]
MRKIDPSWAAFTSKRWLNALTLAMPLGTLMYVAQMIIAMTLMPASPTMLGYFVEVAPLYYPWLTLGAVYLLTQAKRSVTPGMVQVPESKIETLFANRIVSRVRLSILVLGIGLAIFSRIAMQFLVATFGVEALSFGLPSVPATQILFAVISLLLPIAFVAYALPLSVWARRAAKANLSTKREVDAVSWVTLTRSKVRFFRWFMVGCVAWLFLVALLTPLITRADMLLSLLLGLSLYAILGLYSVWVPGAIIRLRWLFETEVGRHFKAVAGFLRFVSWSMPITLAFAGLLPGLVFSSRLGQMSDSLPHLILGQLLQVNLIVLYP